MPLFTMVISTDSSLLVSGKLELTVEDPSKSRQTTGVRLYGNVLSTLVLTAMSTYLMLSGMLISEMEHSEALTKINGMAARP